MKAFILAAGFGTRLKPITNTLPKPLIPVWGVPSICFSLMLVREAGVEELVINLHYKPEMIKEYFRRNDNFGFTIHFSYEEKILGTGGGLKKCEKFLDDSPFFILNADVITDISLGDVVEHSFCEGVTALPILVPSHGEAAPVSVDNDKITDFKNALKTHIPGSYDYSGMALATPEIFRYLQSDFSSIVYTAYTDLIQKSTLPFYLHSSCWEDIGTLENYQKINREVLFETPGLVTRLKDALGVDSSFEEFLTFIRGYKGL